MTAASKSDWWIEDNGEHAGPFSIATVRSRLADSEVTSDTLACPVGGDEWKPLKTWEAFSDIVTTSGKVPPPPPLPTSPAVEPKTSSSQPASSQQTRGDSKSAQAELKRRLKNKHENGSRNEGEDSPDLPVDAWVGIGVIVGGGLLLLLPIALCMFPGWFWQDETTGVSSTTDGVERMVESASDDHSESTPKQPSSFFVRVLFSLQKTYGWIGGLIVFIVLAGVVRWIVKVAQ